MIDTILVITGTALLLIGLYPFVMDWLRAWAHNIIAERAMLHIDTELDWLLNE